MPDKYPQHELEADVNCRHCHGFGQYTTHEAAVKTSGKVIRIKKTHMCGCLRIVPEKKVGKKCQDLRFSW